MHKFSIFFLTCFLVSAFPLLSQNSTNSPYTRFGYGDVSEITTGSQLGMGGIGAGVRSSTGINRINPASYSNIDSVTFLFDLGASSRLSRFTDVTGSRKYLNGNLEYIQMQFPITKFIGFSMGVLPYSTVGYNFNVKNTLKIPNPTAFTDTTISYVQIYNGTGGISQAYMGTGIRLGNHISLGVNAYYMFGQQNISRRTDSISSVYAYTSSQNQNINFQGFRFRYGLQYFNTFASKHSLTLGLIYEEKTNLNVSQSKITTGAINDTLASKGGFQTPRMFGAGFTYIYDNKLTIGFDYSQKQWSDALFYNQKDSLVTNSKYAFGVEYLPNVKSRKYMERIRYRAGVTLTDSYFRVNGVIPPQDLAIRFGIGLPFRNTKSCLNATIEYGKSGVSSLLREDYFKFSVNVLFNEYWFFKRKL